MARRRTTVGTKFSARLADQALGPLPKPTHRIVGGVHDGRRVRVLGNAGLVRVEINIRGVLFSATVNERDLAPLHKGATKRKTISASQPQRKKNGPRKRLPRPAWKARGE